MTWFFAVLLVLAVGAVAVVFAHGGAMMTPAEDEPRPARPDGEPLTGADLRDARFDTVLRGYRADQVDDLLEQLARQLDQRDPRPSPAPQDPDRD